MKKLIIAVSAFFMAIASLSAAEAWNGKYVTKDYDLKNFTGIVASGIYEIQLEKSNTWKVSISVPDELVSYLDVRSTNGKLVLAMKQIPLKITRNYKDLSVVAKVAMPTLKDLHLSGATKFVTSDSFDLGNDTFKLGISGASKANGLNLSAKELDVEMSGATSADIAGEFDLAEIEMGGAAKCNFDINAGKLDQELSGAAKAYHTGDFESAYVEASGACVFSFKGNANYMDIEGSGAAKIETTKGSAKEVKASVSGAAYCEINALDKLQVDASGGGSVRYVDNADLKLDIRSISRGASVSRMR